MNTIQAMWNIYSAEKPSNNTLVQRIKRDAFRAGAEMMRDHLNTDTRLAAEFIDANQATLELVGGTACNEEEWD